MLGAEDLTPEDDMPIGRNVLELTDVRQSNNYTCVAMSTLGVIEAVAQIIVKGERRMDGGFQEVDYGVILGRLKLFIMKQKSVILNLFLFPCNCIFCVRLYHCDELQNLVG